MEQPLPDPQSQAVCRCPAAPPLPGRVGILGKSAGAPPGWFAAEKQPGEAPPARAENSSGSARPATLQENSVPATLRTGTDKEPGGRSQQGWTRDGTGSHEPASQAVRRSARPLVSSGKAVVGPAQKQRGSSVPPSLAGRLLIRLRTGPAAPPRHAAEQHDRACQGRPGPPELEPPQRPRTPP